MSNNVIVKNESSGGIGFCGLLTLLFVALKLTGYIDWSWWVVTAPMWVPLVVILALIIVGVYWGAFMRLRGMKRK